MNKGIVIILLIISFIVVYFLVKRSKKEDRSVSPDLYNQFSRLEGKEVEITFNVDNPNINGSTQNNIKRGMWRSGTLYINRRDGEILTASLIHSGTSDTFFMYQVASIREKVNYLI